MPKSPNQPSLNRNERQAALWLASVFSLRMLGLFMILPVFALYAEQLHGNTPALAGLAIGVYGLSQALLQIPFGLLSDRFGRKRMIYLGLLIFALGSVVAALADSIWGVILGRALQGGGAVSAAVMALAADLTSEQQRLRVMALIGITIGISFAVSMILGPVLNAWIGVPGIFWLTAVLALLGIAVVRYRVPNPRVSHIHRDAEPVVAQLGRVLGAAQLWRLHFGIFVLHLLLTATFVAIPLALRAAGLPSAHHWQVYLPTLTLAMLLIIPLVILAEKRQQLKSVMFAAVAVLALTELGLAALPDTVLQITLLLLTFFTAFNLLEALLPSLISKLAPADAKGTAMGVYSTSQFLGAAVGGILGGWFYQHGGLATVFIGCAVLCAIWLAFAVTMREPPYVTSLRLPLSPDAAADAGLAERLLAVPGVADAMVVAEEAAAYVKVDTEQLDRTSLERLVDPAPRRAEA